VRRRRRGRRAGTVVVSVGNVIVFVVITVSVEEGTCTLGRAESPPRGSVGAVGAEVLAAPETPLEKDGAFGLAASNAPLVEVGHQAVTFIRRAKFFIALRVEVYPPVRPPMAV